jgi:hypothetical protein
VEVLVEVILPGLVQVGTGMGGRDGLGRAASIKHNSLVWFGVPGRGLTTRLSADIMRT